MSVECDEQYITIYVSDQCEKCIYIRGEGGLKRGIKEDEINVQVKRSKRNMKWVWCVVESMFFG